MERRGGRKEQKRKGKRGREVGRVVKRREGEGAVNRMEGIWNGRQDEKEVEKEEKRMEEVI